MGYRIRMVAEVRLAGRLVRRGDTPLPDRYERDQGGTG